MTKAKLKCSDQKTLRDNYKRISLLDISRIFASIQLTGFMVAALVKIIHIRGWMC